MQSKQAHPAGIMNGFQMRMVAFFGDLIRNIVNGDHTIKNRQARKNQEEKCQIV